MWPMLVNMFDSWTFTLQQTSLKFALQPKIEEEKIRACVLDTRLACCRRRTEFGEKVNREAEAVLHCWCLDAWQTDAKSLSQSTYIKYQKKIRNKSETLRKKWEAEAVLHCWCLNQGQADAKSPRQSTWNPNKIRKKFKTFRKKLEVGAVLMSELRTVFFFSPGHCCSL